MYYRRKRILKKVMFSLALVAVAAALLTVYFNIRLRPVVREMAVARSRTIATRAINDAINKTVSDSNVTYDDLIRFEKNDSGGISALKTDIVSVNRLKSALSVSILEGLSNISDDELAIPIGSILSGDLLSGRGFKLKIKLVPIGSVSTDITNSFSSAGINQTLHRINLEVHAVISLIMPTMSTNVEVVSSVCIAETVIVGDVPSAYTKVVGQTDDTVGIINDFQSTLDSVG